MLKKVLKYDLKSMFKFLIKFYSLSIFFAILTRIFLNIENSFLMNIIGQICTGATIAMVFNILINNIIRFWVKFKQVLYGDESYLTHTLPIKKKTIYLSKIITAIITLFTSIIVIALTLFIAYYSKETIEIIKNFLLPFADIYGSDIIPILLVLFFILFLEFANILQIGFSGIILGHKMNNSKTGYSILFGFIVYMISQTIMLLMLFIMALFNSDIMNLFITNEMINMDSIKTVIYASSIIYSIILTVSYIVNVKLFNQGVNVD